MESIRKIAAKYPNLRRRDIVIDIIDEHFVMFGHSDDLYIICSDFYKIAAEGSAGILHLFPEVFHMSHHKIFKERLVFLDNILPDKLITIDFVKEGDADYELSHNEFSLWEYPAESITVDAFCHTHKQIWANAISRIVKEYHNDDINLINEDIVISGLAKKIEIIKLATDDNYDLIKENYLLLCP